MLWNFLPRFNQRFGVAPAQPGSAYRQLTPGVSLDATLCFKYLRTVANDNTVRFNGATIQLLADDLRSSYARAKVEVQERLDGQHSSPYTKARPWPQRPAPHGPVILRARNGRRSNGHLTSTGASTHSAQKPNPRPTTKTKTGPPRKPAPTTHGEDPY